MSTAHEIMHLSLSTALPGYWPGDTVTALLLASTQFPEDVELQEMEISFSGIERVDTSWVAPTYRKDVPAINTDRRRIQRHVVQAHLHAATQGNFADANARRFLIRFTLPTWLPPAFKGAAVRNSYYLEAKLTFRRNNDDQEILNDQPNSSAAMSTVSRVPVQIWPAKSSMAGLTRSTTSSADIFPFDVANSDNGGGSSTEEPSIKCWEVGSGTSVEDAMSHISKVVGRASEGALMPFTPGRVKQQEDLPALVHGRAVTSDSASEISHEEPERTSSIRDVGHHSKELSLSVSVPLSRQSTGSAAEVERLIAPRTASAIQSSETNTWRSFALRMGDHHLARVTLIPPLSGPLRPGATFSGVLEFPSPMGESCLRCVQVTVLLETEEMVDAAWRTSSRGASAIQASGLRRMYDEHVETTADTDCTNFTFTLPPDAQASFQTPLIALKWVLKFIFAAVLLKNEGGKVLYGPTETLTWAVPLVVLPPMAGNMDVK